MKLGKPKKQKGRLATHASNLNMLLLVLVLITMMAIVVVIINSVNNDTAMNLVQAYSMEAAEKFYSYVGQDLILMRKTAFSRAITGWFADEENEAKKALALDEMMEYVDILRSTRLYLGIQKTMNEYTLEKGAALADLVPNGRLDPTQAEDSWYFEYINSKNEYTLKIDAEKASQTWHLWINHKVIENGELAGVFCSGLRIPDVFDKVFGDFEAKKVRGYIIDSQGIIQLDSAANDTSNDIYKEENQTHISQKSSDPAFAAVLASYLGRIDGFFNDHSRAEVLKLAKGPYAYTSIEPISSTDWSVVVFYNSGDLFGVKNLLPPFLIMLLVLLLYVIGRNIVMNRLIFKPIDNVIQNISKSKEGDSGFSGGISNDSFFGSNHNDEIGQLVRTIQDVTHDKENQDRLLHAVNSAAVILLAPVDEEDFEGSLLEGMDIIGRCVDVDRLYIWRNEIIDGVFCYIKRVHWLSEVGQQHKHAPAMRPYSEIPEWESKFLNDEYINGPLSTRTAREQNILGQQGVKSILAIPMYMQGRFYGFFRYDDCHSERYFTENEVKLLRAAGVMMVSALNRNEMALNINAVAAKLGAVIANYPGIIWCVDKNRVITLFNGLYLNELGLTPESFEGKHLDDALHDKRFSDIRTSVHKTFTEGHQDLNIEINDRAYRIRTTPIYDDSGNMTGIVGNFDDITERTRLQRDLKIALKASQTSSQAKSTFLANMSHEMRTPLNAVIGLSELILDAGGLSEEVSVNLEKIYNAGETLLSTVNDILDISKIEAGRYQLIPIEYDIPSLINDTVSQSIMRIGEKPITFLLDIAENLPTRLYGDDLRVKQMLNNLLSNAFKYTEKGTVELNIQCEREPGSDMIWLIAQVRDTGRGIRNEDISRLFTDYIQVDTEHNRKIEGIGLGLSITKRVAELMNGSINVKSAYGKGSIFTIRIQQKCMSNDVIGADVVDNLKQFRYSETKRKRNLHLSRIKLPYARVLVVDDVITNLDVAKGMMKPYAMQIDCVESGQAAIDAIRAEKVRYNAVFMDHMMPGMDGIEATRIIREEIGTEYAKTVPIIALTANAIVGNEEMFLSKGFQAFISKPIEITLLDSVLRQWVRDKTREEEFVIESNEQPAETQTFSSRIDGVDLQKGLKRFNGDMKSFLQVLRSYAINTPPLLAGAKNVTAENLPDYAIIVHGIKSSSRGICAETIGEAAEALEKAAKEKNLDFINDNNAVFVEAVERLAAGLMGMIRDISIKEQKPKKDKPDDALLFKLLTACRIYDMDGADTAMAEIENFEYESGEELVTWLRQNVDQVNFKQIKEKLITVVGTK